jgi:HEAT repeat protein
MRTGTQALRAWAPYLVMVMAVAILPSPYAHAEGETPAETDPAAAARRQLEEALSSDDGNQRFPAMRVARFMDDPWIAVLVAPLCESPDLVEKVLALEVVTNTDPAVCRDAFLEALNSGERALRLRGLLGFAALGDPDTVPRLVEIMNDDPDPDLRAAAARTIGLVGDLKASISLYEAIGADYAPLREQAVLALMIIGDDGVGNYLIDRLVNDHHPGEAETLRLLSLMEDPALVESIEPYLHHEDHVYRTLAAAAILSILERSGNAQP